MLVEAPYLSQYNIREKRLTNLDTCRETKNESWWQPPQTLAASVGQEKYPGHYYYISKITSSSGELQLVHDALLLRFLAFINENKMRR